MRKVTCEHLCDSSEGNTLERLHLIGQPDGQRAAQNERLAGEPPRKGFREWAASLCGIDKTNLAKCLSASR